MLRFFRSIFAAVVILAAVIQPAAAPARAGVFPMQSANNILLPTQSPFSGTGWANSGAGWNIPQAHPVNGPAITGLDLWMTLGENFDAPTGHTKYTVARSSNSCLAVVAATWREAGGALRRGLGVWDACVYNGWIDWMWASDVEASGYTLTVSGRKLVHVKIIKAGAFWQTWIYHQASNTWDPLAFDTLGTGPGVGAVHFLYSQSPAAGGCAATVRPHASNIIAEIVPGGWQNVSDFRGLSSLTGCFATGGWSRSEGPSWVRANTPNP